MYSLTAKIYAISLIQILFPLILFATSIMKFSFLAAYRFVLRAPYTNVFLSGHVAVNFYLFLTTNASNSFLTD